MYLDEKKKMRFSLHFAHILRRQGFQNHRGIALRSEGRLHRGTVMTQNRWEIDYFLIRASLGKELLSVI